MHKFVLNGLLIISGVLCVLPAVAESSAIADENQPVNIQADQLNASEKLGKSIYQGNVIVTQGSLTLKGDLIEVFHPDGKLQKTITKGTPATFKRFEKSENAWVKGSANSIEYNTSAKTVLLIGNARVEQPGKHTIEGPKLYYDINQQTLQAESTPDDKKRVSVTFTPDSTSPANKQESQ